MLSARGTPITPRSERDAEALEIAPDGTVLVSFEGRHRLWRYPAPPAHFQAPASELGGLAAWSALPINGGFEAMASLTGNRRLVIAERARADEGSLAGWLLEHGRHKQLTYETVGQFVPTDLARLASGDLVALERRFTPVGGFASRLQIIDQQSITAGARLRGREIARLQRPLLIENFEGVAVRNQANGTARIYVVSDDNYNPLQRTLLLAFTLEAATSILDSNNPGATRSPTAPVR